MGWVVTPASWSSGIRVPAPRSGCRPAGIAGASWRRPVRRRAPGPGRPLPADPPAPQAIICPAGLSQPRAGPGGNDTNGPLLPPGDTDGPWVLPRPYGPAARCRSADTSAAASGDRPPDRPDRGRVGEVLYRRCAPRPHGRAAGARLAAMCQVVNVASITRRRAELTEWLGDLAKTPLPGRVPQPHGSGRPRRRIIPGRRGTGPELLRTAPARTGGSLCGQCAPSVRVMSVAARAEAGAGAEVLVRPGVPGAGEVCLGGAER